MAKRRMRFGTWCRKDPEDETMIVYAVHFKEWDGTIKTEYFTSDDIVSVSTIHRLREMWIKTVERVKNEFQDAWVVELYED